MKFLISFILICTLGSAVGQQSYRNELMKLLSVADLPSYRDEPIKQLSSYDRTGGNDDGFSGKFSFIRKERGELVIADLKGPGVINRIWTPTPSNDTIRFYFDGETTPRINMPFINLFSGQVFPFVEPLCGNELGGYFCYLPISYSKSLKIVYKGDGLKFHQTQYRTLSNKSNIESFSQELLRSNEDILEDIDKIWNSRVKPIPTDVKQKNVQLTIAPGETANLLKLNGGGRIVGIEINAGDALKGNYRDLILSARWDNERHNAMELPMADFFGYAYGKPAMRSFLCGTKDGISYSYFPMPFDQLADMNISYRKRGGDQKVQQLSATIYYTDAKRDPKTEGKFYAGWNREKPAKGSNYLIADIKGRGHYVGTSLIAQGLEGGMTLFWEGDDRSTVDGELTFHGTGSEDYFNGGWYAVTDRWDRGMSCPIHGALDYDIKTCRTGGYRFFLSDKINFNNSYNLTIEHGPEDNLLAVDYASVSYFYADAPKFNNRAVTDENATADKLSKSIVLAQDFTVRPYWFTSVGLEEGYAEIKSGQKESWMTNIDFEAVPMVQFELQGVDFGRYKLSIVYTKQANDQPFSVWQRTKQLSGWIENSGTNNAPTTLEVGEIEINEQLSTITLRRKKTGQTTVKIHSFLLEPLDE